MRIVVIKRNGKNEERRRENERKRERKRDSIKPKLLFL